MSWLYLLLSLLLCWTACRAGRSSRDSEGKGSPWWGLASSSHTSNSVLDPRTSSSIPGSGLNSAVYPALRRKQRRLVKDNPGVLAAVARGLKVAVDECQYQFKDRRWNCPTSDFLKEKNIFGKIVQIGKRQRMRDSSQVTQHTIRDLQQQSFNLPSKPIV